MLGGVFFLLNFLFVQQVKSNYFFDPIVHHNLPLMGWLLCILMVMVLLVLFCWWRQCFFVFVFDIGGGADGCGGVGGGSGCVSSGWLREGGG